MMNKTIVQQVVSWFANNCEQLSESFPIVRFRLTQASDEIQGKVIVELDGESAAAMITFWNKGDVQALLLETVSKKEHTLDDRMLTPQDNIPSLLRSYVQRFGGLDQSLDHPT
jgi:hypothetical protein